MKSLVNRTAAVLTMFVLILTGFSISNIEVSATTNEYKTWKQSDSRWGTVNLGSSGGTMKSIGCAVTSVAILMVQSGAMDEADFNPGVLCNFLSNNGGFDGYGNIYWGAATKLNNNFTYEGGGVLSGTQSQKTDEIQSYINSGYAVMVSVKNKGHWVAIDSVSNGTTYMVDPARTSTTELFSAYNASGVTSIRLFKNSKNSASVNTETKQNVTNEQKAEVKNATYTVGKYSVKESLNFRTGSATTYDSISLISSGTHLKVTEISGNWGKVLHNGQTGWICLDYAEYLGNLPVYERGVYTTIADLNHRSGSGISNSSNCIIPNGTKLNISEIYDEWGKVIYNGVEGWVSLDYTEYEGQLPSSYSTGKYIVNELINFRTKTESDAPSYGLIPSGTVVKVIEVDYNWGKIEYRGRTAWICLDYATSTYSDTTLTGDLNQDGNVTNDDIRLMAEGIANGKKYSYEEIVALDIDGDSEITAKDIAKLD